MMVLKLRLLQIVRILIFFIPRCTGSRASRHHRYHDMTSSFASLATQSSVLSQSPSALFDRDHPSIATKGRDGMSFREQPLTQLNALRKKLGLEEWDL